MTCYSSVTVASDNQLIQSPAAVDCCSRLSLSLITLFPDNIVTQIPENIANIDTCLNSQHIRNCVHRLTWLTLIPVNIILVTLTPVKIINIES